MGSAPHKRDQRARAQIQPPCTHWLMRDNIDRLAEPSVAKLVGNRRGQYRVDAHFRPEPLGVWAALAPQLGIAVVISAG